MVSVAVPVFRPAVPADAAMCIEIRGRTRENTFSAAELQALGITQASWSEGIEDGSLPGVIACVDGRMAGYCFGDRDSGEIVVLALLPEHEGKGLGKALLQHVVEDFRRLGMHRLFLGCSSDPLVRSHGFYRHLGWQPTGEIDDLGDEILVLSLD